MKHEGVIGIPGQNGRYTTVKYELSANKRRGKNGINNGRITELTLSIDGEITVRYNHGWTREADAGLPTQMALCILLENHN